MGFCLVGVPLRELEVFIVSPLDSFVGVPLDSFLESTFTRGIDSVYTTDRVSHICTE